jgi:hypothetical protein
MQQLGQQLGSERVFAAGHGQSVQANLDAFMRLMDMVRSPPSALRLTPRSSIYCLELE